VRSGSTRSRCSARKSRRTCSLRGDDGLVNASLPASGRSLHVAPRDGRDSCRLSAGGGTTQPQHTPTLRLPRGADAATRSWPAARSRLAVIVVPAGQALGLLVRPGGGAAARLRNTDPDGPLLC